MAMSDAQIAELYERLTAAMQPRPAVDQVFLRGWNAGIESAIGHLRKVCDEAVAEPMLPSP